MCTFIYELSRCFDHEQVVRIVNFSCCIDNKCGVPDTIIFPKKNFGDWTNKGESCSQKLFVCFKLTKVFTSHSYRNLWLFPKIVGFMFQPLQP